MTGNQHAPYVQTNQGPRGLPGANGVPFTRRKRRALIDVKKIDAEARAKNAKLEAERIALLEKDPAAAAAIEAEMKAQAAAEEAAAKAKLPANDSDHPSQARATIEEIDRRDRAGSRGALEETGDLDLDDLKGFQPPAENLTDASLLKNTPEKAPVGDSKAASAEGDSPQGKQAAKAPAAKRAAKKKPAAKKPARKRATKTTTTTIET